MNKGLNTSTKLKAVPSSLLLPAIKRQSYWRSRKAKKLVGVCATWSSPDCMADIEAIHEDDILHRYAMP